MATGSVIVFDEAKAKMLDGNWASTDVFYFAVIDNTLTPAASDATPTWSDYSANEVTAAGSYTANGYALEALSVMVTESGGVMKFDTANNPTWTQNASNATDAWWGIVYNFTDANKDALMFIELGGPVDMTAGSLTYTWPGAGAFTIT